MVGCCAASQMHSQHPTHEACNGALSQRFSEAGNFENQWSSGIQNHTIQVASDEIRRSLRDEKQNGLMLCRSVTMDVIHHAVHHRSRFVDGLDDPSGNAPERKGENRLGISQHLDGVHTGSSPLHPPFAHASRSDHRGALPVIPSERGS
jgi:hypothetical protein